MERPKLSDFEAQKGQAFQVLNPEGDSLATWRLTSIKIFDAPDEDGLRDLECFSLSFLHEANEILPQGIYTLTSEDHFQTQLFAVPFRNDEMTVTIN
ncbi:MAG: hypothetical protein ACJAVK_003312 [Akkermansiaceae bacterium]|jgi:hypothetical protein